MAQSDDKIAKKEDITKTALTRENRRLEADVKRLSGELDEANKQLRKLEVELDAANKKFSDIVRSQRVTIDPGAGTPVSCIEDIGGEPDAVTRTKKR